MRLPARIGKYELQEFLGGAMSQVYRAEDTVIGRTVALKILTDAGVSDKDAKARFLHEARTAGGIQHDNICAVFDYGEDQGRPFIVMEFLRGEDIASAIKGNRLGSIQDRLRIGRDVARALGHIHSLGIIHRDIKPENIRIEPSGKVKLMDFGIAKAHDLSLTKTGVSMGTPFYMAPEQILGKELSNRCDIYSFGLMLYEMFTGVKAFNADTIERLFFRILNEPLDPGVLHAMGVPPAAVNLMMRCAAKNPADRPQSFQEVEDELNRILSGDADPGTFVFSNQPFSQPQPAQGSMTGMPPVGMPPPPMPAQPQYQSGQIAAPPVQTGSRKGLWFGLLAILVIVGLAAAGWFYTRPKPLASSLETTTGLMLLIPGGEFPAGPAKTPKQVAPFYMDQTEVSNKTYAMFCKATNRPMPEGDPSLPVVRVTIDDARAFARWAGKRLPKPDEWEKAARGPKGSVYPWGDEADPRMSNLKGNTQLPKPGLLPVNAAFAQSVNAYGLYHLGGNVFEYVDAQVQPSPTAVTLFRNLVSPPATMNEPWVQIRGGSFNTGVQAAITYEWTAVPARYFSVDIGFRCVKDPQ
jgi:serine/threonine-protein kinase